MIEVPSFSVDFGSIELVIPDQLPTGQRAADGCVAGLVEADKEAAQTRTIAAAAQMENRILTVLSDTSRDGTSQGDSEAPESGKSMLNSVKNVQSSSMSNKIRRQPVSPEKNPETIMLAATDWPRFILHELITPKFIILYLLLASALYVHFRGKVRHKFGRQLTDHSTFMAPYNAMIYLFSAVKNTPTVDPKQFPELDPLQQNWETIRDEARKLYQEGHIQISKSYNDLAFNTFFKRGWKRFYLKWYGDFFPSGRICAPRRWNWCNPSPR